MESQTTAPNEDRGYDVFISFVTDPDYKVARRVRNFLESFSQRVKSSGFDIPPIRAFVDTDSLSRGASNSDGPTDLGDALRRELLRSRYLLILCCTHTPNSMWVQREFEWYIHAHGTASVLLAITDPVDPLANPRSLFPAYVRELELEKRLWYDLRTARARRPAVPGTRPLEDVLTQLAAHLSGRSVAEVTSAWYKEQRRLARIRLVYLSVAAGALLAAVVGGYQTYISRTAEERSAADTFIQAGIKAKSEGDLSGAASAFRESLKHADTRIARLELAGLTNIPVRPLRALDIPVNGERGRLTSVAFLAPRTIATGDMDGNLTLLDIDRGTVLRSVKLPSAIHALAYFPDDKRLFAGLKSGAVYLVTTQFGDASEWKKLPAPVLGLRADSETGNLAVGLDESAGVLVLGRDGHAILNIDVHTGNVKSLAFSRDGVYLYWGGSSPYLWQCLIEESACDRLTSVEQYVYSVDESPSGRYNIVAIGDRFVMFDRALGKMTILSELAGAHAYSVAFDPSSQFAAAASSDGFVSVYDVQSERALVRTRNHKGEAYALAFNSSGDRLVSVGLDGHIGVWRVERSGIVMMPLRFSPSPVMMTPPQRNQILDMRILANNVALVETSDLRMHAFDLDKLQPATGDFDERQLRAQLARSFSLAKAIPPFGGIDEISAWQVDHAAASTALSDVPLADAKGAISPDGRYLAIAAQDGSIVLLDTERPGKKSAKGLTSKPSAITLMSGDPPSIAVGYEDGTVSVFDGKSLERRHTNQVHTGSVQLMLFSEAVGALFTSGQDGWIRASAPADGHVLHAFEAVATRAIAVSPNGRLLAVGGVAGAIEMLDAPAMQLIATLPGNRGGVNALGFDEAGTNLYSAGFDEMVRKWGVAAIETVAFGAVSDVLAISAPASEPLAAGPSSDTEMKRDLKPSGK